ncbi:hypothetical protein LCGC14_3064890, partial [marine sediment metagenome]
LQVEPPARCNSRMVYDARNKVIVLFGGDGQDRALADTWVFDVTAKRWRQKSPPASPHPRSCHAMTYLSKSGRVLMVGGKVVADDRSIARLTRQAWVYDAAADTWTPLAAEVPKFLWGSMENVPGTDEAIQVLRKLWTEDNVTFDGRFTKLDGVTLQPKPAQSGGPPLWIAGRSQAALRRAGHEVDDWDGHYPVIYEKLQRDVPAYLPANANDYDVVHLNWHPASINHYLPEHFAGLDHPVLSIRVTDLPPWSGCPCLEPFTVRITAEPHELSTLVVPNPVVDWADERIAFPAPNEEFTIGFSGVRLDGYGVIKEICQAHGWALNESGAEWLTIEDEIRRLARSTVNVCWYRG